MTKELKCSFGSRSALDRSIGLTFGGYFSYRLIVSWGTQVPDCLYSIRFDSEKKTVNGIGGVADDPVTTSDTRTCM